ncbi:GDSL-type esterase/lipase family protein [Bacillus sp. HMF5848]|uniref:GDSL-type esterase/lipase family protein n=1 Tax=Bacillus sp. HMF5848 TaxID=2495421 RepID=UPI00163B303A|nr:GDSL-type esterase/lipase family protein [Bacillus sp. HMF5848]
MRRLFILVVVLITTGIITACVPINLSNSSVFLAFETSKRISQPSIKAQVDEEFFAKDIVLTGIGDSLTEGLGDERKRFGYLGDLADELIQEQLISSVSIHNLGIRGYTSYDVLQELKSTDVQETLKMSDIIVMTVGGNDLIKIATGHFLQLSVDMFSKEQVAFNYRLHEIFTSIRQINADAQIIFIGVYNPFASWIRSNDVDTIISKWNDASKQTVLNFSNTKFIPISDIFSDEALLYKDLFHPNTEGYKLIAERVYKNIQDKPVDTETALYE